MTETWTSFFYLVASICFIMSLRGLSDPKIARNGLRFGVAGIVIAIVTTLLTPSILSFSTILTGIFIGGTIGTVIARRIDMKDLPQLMAGFHSLVGLAAVFVAAAAFYNPEVYGIGTFGSISAGGLIEMSIGAAIGAITFTGSIVAFGKLQGLISGKPVTFAGQHKLNAVFAIVILTLIILLASFNAPLYFWGIVVLSFALGILLIIPIGGADMPVIVSMLNSYSGWAAVGIGFTLQNDLLIIVGALVGASGAILSYIMCKGMNRSFFNVVLGGFGGDDTGAGASGATTSGEERPVKIGSADDAAFIMKNATDIIIVPGYGMAVAQAQHALREMVDMLKKEGIRVRYAIHPVAGRMPGHMNVLLADAGVPYEDVFELDEINRDFAQIDVAFVIGANDITNPSAKTDKSSPIYGMPVLDVERAKTVLFIKRSLGSGYAGVENPLFFEDNTMMLLDDAKAMCDGIIRAME